MNVCAEGQPFGVNYNPSYEEGGLRGHTGQDWSCGFGTPIYSPFDGYVYKVLTKQNPSTDGTGFTGVFMIVDDGVECFEWMIGHCDPTVTAGTQVNKGDVIGTEANHGTVYAGNTQITLAMQRAGDQRGHHRHYQKRPVMKVLRTSPNYRYLTTYPADSISGGFYRDQVGYYYQDFNYENGFDGCVSPTKPVLQRDLWYGSQGYDVYVLQRYLAKLGFFGADPTAYFGTITGAAVKAFQRSKGITPLLGYVGVKTKAVINIPTPDLSGE
jgi:hypothetical protein